jgi:GntR family transcriptional regulator/MocR family aminotransferase
MAAGLRIRLDRKGSASLTEQISQTIRAAILEGRLEPGARLPSWRDLAVQLGVARGTVRVAYERLADEMLVTTSGPAGTHVTPRPPRVSIASDHADGQRSFPSSILPFQMGVPAYDAFPFKLWGRVLARAARAEAAAPGYPDPRGATELRTQLAGYLALARGIRCTPEQIVITRGFRDGLNLAIRTLAVAGREAWMEDPGFSVTRSGLALAGMRPVPVRVDSQGLDVRHGLAAAPDAALAVVTAGQQAPLGVALADGRRHALLRWATRAGSWVIEDDYLSELQLLGRAAPALVSMDPAGRVIYAGTFSKTMSPSLNLGFIVVPKPLVARFAEVVRCLAPANNAMMQLAAAEFLRDGHYLRHLRRMKRLYAARRHSLERCLAGMPGVDGTAGLAVLIRLPRGSDDVAIVDDAMARGLAPASLSSYYAREDERNPGLLLCVTNVDEASVQRSCDRLRSIVARHAGALPRTS